VPFPSKFLRSDGRGWRELASGGGAVRGAVGEAFRCRNRKAVQWSVKAHSHCGLDVLRTFASGFCGEHRQHPEVRKLKGWWVVRARNGRRPLQSMRLAEYADAIGRHHCVRSTASAVEMPHAQHSTRLPARRLHLPISFLYLFTEYHPSYTTSPPGELQRYFFTNRRHSS